MTTTAGETKRPAESVSAWAPFAHASFAVLWAATVLSNVGTWMHDVAAGWLMTSLSPSPLMVALVQAATTAPIFLFALGAGALADLADRRKLLIAVSAFLAITALVLAVLVTLDLVSPWILLVFTFLSGTGAAFLAPAWHSIVPQLVPRAQLQSAITLNGAGVNISRAIGPALAGLIIAALGIAWPFFLNAASYLIVIAALLWWRPPPSQESYLPAERFWSAIRSGLRYARANPPLRATIVRAMAFFIFASAYWALLPLIAREELAGGPELYGLMLGAVGLGAVIGALFLPKISQWLGPDAQVAAGTGGTALVLVVFALTGRPGAAILASLAAGVSWIVVLASLNVSAQVALPDWVRARGLSVFVAVLFGSMALGSVVWGQAATWFGIPPTLIVAAVGALAAAVLSWPFKLQLGAKLDLSPSFHLLQPLVALEVDHDRGPAMITVEYRIDPARGSEFVEAMQDVQEERQRGGAFAWGLFEDVADPGRYLEYFMTESWLAHLRHHERVSAADRVVLDRARSFQVGGSEPVVTHYVAPDPKAQPASPPADNGELG